MVADEGMQVVVKPGACLIEGATGYETESRTMVVQAAGSTDRIDSVVLRLNDNLDFRDIDLYVVKGNSSTEPPQLTRTGGIYEIGLANLYVSANSSTITTERITDTRLVTARCGYAMPVQEFDTTALFDQLQAQVNENIELIQRAINQTEAAHLQEQIDSISSDIGTASIASISDGTIKGAVAKHEQDVNSLNLKIPSKLSQLSNDTGFITNSTRNAVTVNPFNRIEIPTTEGTRWLYHGQLTLRIDATKAFGSGYYGDFSLNIPSNIAPPNSFYGVQLTILGGRIAFAQCTSFSKSKITGWLWSPFSGVENFTIAYEMLGF